MIEQFINFVIRPPRAVYDPNLYLWERDFTLAGRAYKREDLELSNGKGHTLKCSHYVPSIYAEDSPLPCVIYCHGNSGCRADANEAAVVLLPANITVFTLDFSGSGLSDGNYVSLGWHEKDDLRVVVSYLRSNKRVSQIGLWGRSMGAVTSLLYGSVDPSITGMVLDSAFSNLFDLMMELVDVYKIRLPKFTVKMAVQYMRRVIQKRAKFDIMDLNCMQVASKTFIPTLFGHANGDKFIQPHHSDAIFKLYGGDKNIIKFDGDHNSSRPQFYYDSVSIFFYNILRPPQFSSTWSSKIEKYQSLKDLTGGAGIDERLLYEVITNLRMTSTDVASSSSILPSISTTKSVGDSLSEIAPILSTSDMVFNEEVCAADGHLQDKTDGAIEEGCSYTSSDRESWGRCSSLEGSESAECTFASNSDQISSDVLGTSTFPNLDGLPDDKKKTRNRKKVSVSASKKPKREKSDKIGTLSQRLRLCVLKRINHRKILGVPTRDLKEDFDSVASESMKDPTNYARNLLEYCCFRALALSMQVAGYLADKKFRRLTFDMMLAWECPAAASQPLLDVDEDATVGLEAFSRIAPAVPIIANVVISKNLFDVLTSSTGGRLQYSVYEKYLIGLERAIKKLKTQSDSSLLSVLRSDRREKIVEVDGTVTTQPVLQHVGISTWPGRLILTDHALYFEPLKVVSYDKAIRYDLADDLKQVVKPELTGPWGTRLFDKAVSYKSISLSEPIVMEFPELKGHSRRDYWLAVIQEILLVHRFIRMYKIVGLERDEALLRAIFGILQLQAVLDMSSLGPVRCETFLLFNLCDHLPGGDMILETLANMSALRESDRTGSPRRRIGMYSSSALAIASNLGFGFGASEDSNHALLVGEIVVGGMTPLEKAVNESRSSYEKVVLAQETVDGVKVDGIDTNLAVMKELLFPLIELSKSLFSLAYWEEPLKSVVFCVAFTYCIFRGWLVYVLALPLILLAVFMVLTRWFNQGRPIVEVKVLAPPPKNAMEQLLAVQNAISQAEEFIQHGNIVLLKIRALLLSIFPQASEKCAILLLLLAVVLAFLPMKYIILVCFLEAFTRYSPLRKASTERWERRLREWWFSIPAAPVALEREKEDKKRK